MSAVFPPLKKENSYNSSTENDAERGKRSAVPWDIRGATGRQGWAKLVLIALERYSVELKRLTFNFR